MSDKIALTYFDAAGLCFPTRAAFTIGKIPFEDIRINFEDFSKLQSTYPVGQLPILKVGDKIYTQSLAHAIYAAQKANLYPTCPEQQLHVNEVISLCVELFFGIPRNTGSEETDELARQNFSKKTINNNYDYLEKMLAGSASGYFGKQLSLADLYLYTHYVHLHNVASMSFYKGISLPKGFAAYPNIRRLCQQVSKHEALKEYFANHSNEHVQL